MIEIQFWLVGKDSEPFDTATWPAVPRKGDEVQLPGKSGKSDWHDVKNVVWCKEPSNGRLTVSVVIARRKPQW